MICHGDDVRLANVQEMVALGNDVVYIPVKALVCQTCGERYYDRRTMRFLENTEEELRQGVAALQEVGRVLVYA